MKGSQSFMNHSKTTADRKYVKTLYRKLNQKVPTNGEISYVAEGGFYWSEQKEVSVHFLVCFCTTQIMGPFSGYWKYTDHSHKLCFYTDNWTQNKEQSKRWFMLHRQQNQLYVNDGSVSLSLSSFHPLSATFKNRFVCLSFETRDLPNNEI